MRVEFSRQCIAVQESLPRDMVQAEVDGLSFLLDHDPGLKRTVVESDDRTMALNPQCLFRCAE